MANAYDMPANRRKAGMPASRTIGCRTRGAGLHVDLVPTAADEGWIVMDNHYDVTIVIPVYNVELYLQECLDSIASQTIFSSCEIVIVDDGSTDASAAIAKQFAAAHANVVLQQNANGGPGRARNDAMDLARGRFIAFCDSDDILPPRAMQRLRDALLTHESTIAVGNMQTFPKPTRWPWQKYFGSGDRLIASIVDAPDLIFSPSVCNKMYNLADLRASGLRFKEGVHFEDAYVAVPTLLRSGRIALVDELVYHYRKRPTADSIMDGLFTRKQNYWDHLTLVQALADLRAELDFGRRDALDRLLVRSYQGFAMRAHTLFGEPELRRIFDACVPIYSDIDPSTIAAWTADARHRVPYLAFKMGDFGLFANPASVLKSVVARDGDLFFDYPALPELLPLTQVQMSAFVERVVLTPGGGEIQVSGRFKIIGLPLSQPMTNDLAVRLKGTAVTVPAQIHQRPDQKAQRDDLDWTGFTARVPTSALRSGDHHVRLVVMTESGQASCRCVATAAYLRSSRTMRAASRRILPDIDGRSRAQIRVRRQVRRMDAVRWYTKLILKDIKHAIRKKPMWLPRLIWIATMPLMRTRDIWLIGERKDTAQDNSWHLFRHLRKVERRRNVYYVIARNSPDAERLRSLGNVVWHSSLKHKLLFLHATRLINSYDIDAYMLPDDWNRTAYLKSLGWRNVPRRVFLQHGVTVNDVSSGLHQALTGHDLIVAASARERDFLAGHLGYGEGAQALGFPRFDTLIREPGHRRVVFMPTWRSYLVKPSYQRDGAAARAFEGSALFTFLMEFFGSERLQQALRRYGYVLDFMPHYEIRSLVSDLVPSNDVFHVVDTSKRSIQDAMRQCDLYVTDWSSAAFDVAHLGTPVVYAQFDANEFWGGHHKKGYFDYSADGMGPVCQDLEQTVDAIIQYLENGCVREAEYDRRAKVFFAHRDRDNCARVTAAIGALE